MKGVRNMDALAFKQKKKSGWSIEESKELYGIQNWGAEYFDISDEGNIVIKAPFESSKVAVPILDIVEGMQERGMEMPTVLRVANLLDDRIKSLNESFHRAIEEYDYQNVYRGVFPIKVNQQCHVIEEVADFGVAYNHGFEAGSKAELIIAITKLKDEKSLIICNGNKDSEFIELGLYAKEMGIKCFFVIETLTELPTILECSRRLGIEPLLGVRVRSTVKVDGHWNNNSGDRSIFGLSTTFLIQMVEDLKQAGMLHCLQLLHCHLGSQIPNIRSIRSGVLETCRFYIGLVEEGAPMGYLDLGGGLAIDYEGLRENRTHSMNYEMDEYCVNIVETITESLDPLNIKHPVIVTESGRSIVASSSLLIFNILDVRDHRPVPLPAKLPEDHHELLANLWEVNEIINDKNFHTCYNDALHYRDELRHQFYLGQISLSNVAIGDNLTLSVLDKVAGFASKRERVPEELENLSELLSDVYYGNFSLFQSLPDVWAIDQVLPVMPIHRLNEEPTREAIIADITCDCDGKIDLFTTPDGIKSAIPLHTLKDDEEYYLAVFLVGAYQETLGDLHNLFGDTNVVSVKIHEDGTFSFEKEFHGDSIADVLSYVEYDTKIMTEEFRKSCENAVREGRITAPRRKQMMKAFKESLDGYTYFEKEEY
ncbi:MAG: biosynthetic arginine decarboxylase [Kiritimatiellae bacterium]|jgi:arginine decarboxylase|nr:biosynthetic arginine decarboxylase [Kiritimatiellia bacterium]